MARANLEWRSRPLVWFETRWGLAAFADAARAWGDETTADLLGSVGAGFRVMIPQFQAGCWSFDLAMPTRVTDGRVAWSSTPLFHLRFDQAF
jgi:outer membrane translocation and assembly module TamA